MIFVKIDDGSNTLYCCDTKSKLVGSEGYEKDSQFYYPALLNQPKFSQKGKNWIKISNTTIQIDRELAQVFTDEEVDVTVWLWDEGSATSKFKIFEGVGIRGKFDSVVYNYRLEETDHNLKDDLLSAAPDLKVLIGDSSTFNDDRLFPYFFGYIKYATTLLLATSTSGGVYYSEGECLGLFDGGQSVNFSQSTTQVTKSSALPVYPVTIDIDSISASTGSETSERDAKPYGVITSINGTQTTATRITLDGAYISSQTGVGSTTRLDYEITEDGQSHWYNYDTTSNQWDEIATIGISTVGSDSVIINADNNGETFIPIYANTSSAQSASLFKSTSSGTAIIASGGSSAIGISAGGTIGVNSSSDTGIALQASVLSTGVPLLITPLTSAPTTSVTDGSMYYNSTDDKLYLRANGAWVALN